ncbi:MAG: hypothetical protein U5K84_03115 [Alkalibacterium sp.]|nr:hypothetical protein [Alkalibacterium sp.]
MKELSDNQIKEMLNVNNFREVSKDKIIKFAAMMPDMDKEVAMKMIEKFSEFKQFAKEVMNTLEKEFKNTVESNNDSQAHVFKAFEDTRRILEKELDREELNKDERKEIISHLIELR